VLPEYVEMFVALHMCSYYADGEENNGLHYNEAEDGITVFQAYVIMYACVRNRCYTLAKRRLIDGDTISSVLGDDLTEPIFDVSETNNYDSADGVRSDLKPFRGQCQG